MLIHSFYFEYMINVVGSTPQPVTPLPPDLPGELPMDPTQTGMNPVDTSADAQSMEPISAASAGADSPPSTPSEASQPPKKKAGLPAKSLIAGLVLLLLVLGSGVGLYLMKLNQDLRQQASVYDRSGGGCSGSSDAQCQGKSPGAQCGNNAPFGTCRALNNQEADDGIPCDCSGGGGGDNNPTPTPTRPPAATPTPTTGAPTPTPTDPPVNCRDLGTLATCDANNPPCAWYICSSQCHPQGTSNEDAGCDATAPTATPTPTGTAAATPTPTPTTGTLADAGTTSTTGSTQQPTLPSQLPQSGPEDWLKYLQIGLGVLGAGALLLLFL